MAKWYEVEWTRETPKRLCYSNSKVCDTEEEANALIEELKIKEGIIKIYKITIEKIQQDSINHLARGDF